MNPTSDNPTPESRPSGPGTPPTPRVIGLPPNIPPPWRDAQIERWQQEWKLYRALADDSNDDELDLYPDSDSTGDEVAELPPDLLPPFETEPDTFAPGSIRLLAPEIAPDADRPLYVVVLMDWAEDRKLVAPFGPLSIPASTMEVQTDRDDSQLSVVCLWNARILSSDALAKSWFAGRLEPYELEDVLSVWNHTVSGEPLPAHLLAKVGGPIDEADDPRCEYQSAESEIFASLDAAMLTALETDPLPAPAEVAAGQLWFPADTQQAALLILSGARRGSGDDLIRAVLCSPAAGWPKEWESEYDVFFPAEEAGLWVAHFTHEVTLPPEQIKAGQFLGSLLDDALPHPQPGVAAPEQSPERDAALAELRQLAEQLEDSLIPSPLLECDYELALAAGESNLPERVDVSHLLPGFTGFARGSVRRPGEATVLTFSRPVQGAGEAPPEGIVVSWPGGESRPGSFRENYDDWTAEIEIELQWKDAVALLGEGKLSVAPVQ